MLWFVRHLLKSCVVFCVALSHRVLWTLLASLAHGDNTGAPHHELNHLGLLTATKYDLLTLMGSNSLGCPVIFSSFHFLFYLFMVSGGFSRETTLMMQINLY